MRKIWNNIKTAGKILIIWGLFLLGALIYELMFNGLPNTVESASSDIFFIVVSLGSIFYGFRMSYDRVTNVAATISAKYEIEKFARYRTEIYGPYNSYEDAQIELNNLKAESFDDEVIWEIKKVNCEDSAELSK